MSGTSAAEITICGVRIRIALIALCCLVAQTTAAVVLTRYSKMISDTPLPDGRKPEKYSNASLVVSTEFVKFVASLSLVFFFDTVDKLKSDAKQSKDVSHSISSQQGGGNVSPTQTPSIASQTELKESGFSLNNNNGSNDADGSNVNDHSATASVPMTATLLTDAVPDLFTLNGIAVRYAVWKGILYKENLKDIKGTLKLCVPALLYTVQNNVIYTALNNLEATTFQVGYQSKVVTTAVLSVLMLNRTLTPLKWAALLILTTGIVLTQLQPATDGSASSSSSSSSSKKSSDADSHNNQFIGMIAVMVASFCSAFAGVYFEKILKGTAPSVWVRNAQLAFFSMIIGLIGYIGSVDSDDGFHVMDYFKGYDWLVLMLIAVQALGGLIIACVVKYADNILKGFATAMSIVLCGILSALFMGFFPNVMFVVGSSVVILATLLYSKPDRA